VLCRVWLPSGFCKTNYNKRFYIATSLTALYASMLFGKRRSRYSSFLFARWQQQFAIACFGCRFDRYLALSPLCRFAPWLVRPLADSPTHLGRFAPRCVGESARGRTSHGAKEPGGESSRGRNGKGVNSHNSFDRPHLPFPWGQAPPSNTVKWHLNPTNGLSRGHECDG